MLAGYDRLLADTARLIEEARRTAARSKNAVITPMYWLIGQRIFEHEQQGSRPAGYGKQLIGQLSNDLWRRFGRGFSEWDLEQMRACYLDWPRGQIQPTRSTPGPGVDRDLTREAELLESMRAAPHDDDPKLVYADWLLQRGDERGELIILDHRERASLVTGADELERLLELAAEHGFPRLPDDPCKRILPFYTYSVDYELNHEGRHYSMSWSGRFYLEMDGVTVLDTNLDVLATSRWTFRETTVMLAIISDAILRDARLSELTFPARHELPRHQHYHLGRVPSTSLPHEVSNRPGDDSCERRLEMRDFGRWFTLWDRLQQLRGVKVRSRRIGCACGVEGLTCGIEPCEASSKTGVATYASCLDVDEHNAVLAIDKYLR